MRLQRRFPAVIQYTTRKPDMVIHLLLKIHLTRKVGRRRTDISARSEKLSTTHSDVSKNASCSRSVTQALASMTCPAQRDSKTCPGLGDKQHKIKARCLLRVADWLEMNLSVSVKNCTPSRQFLLASL